MAVNGARVSSLNRTARSAIDTANLKIGGCQSFPNVHSLFQYNYRLTAITRDQRERGLRSREPSRDSPTRTGPDSSPHWVPGTENFEMPGTVPDIGSRRSLAMTSFDPV